MLRIRSEVREWRRGCTEHRGSTVHQERVRGATAETVERRIVLLEVAERLEGLALPVDGGVAGRAGLAAVVGCLRIRG